MKRKKLPLMNYKRGDHAHNLLVAVKRWVESKGGKLLVIGGVEIQDWAEGMGKFKVAVGCLGRMPVKTEKKAA